MAIIGAAATDPSGWRAMTKVLAESWSGWRQPQDELRQAALNVLHRNAGS